jgi:pyruvate-formate lyase-activating enzyme
VYRHQRYCNCLPHLIFRWRIDDDRSPDQNVKHITPPNGSDNVYAIVDKSRKNVPAISGSKGEGTCQPDQIYAVVDKARKRKSSQK